MRQAGGSSRLVLIGLHDPRVGRGNGRGDLQLVKIAAFFIEDPGVDGTLAGRFLKMRAPAGPCACDCGRSPDGGGFGSPATGTRSRARSARTTFNGCRKKLGLPSRRQP